MKEERVMTTHEVSQCRSLLAQGRVPEALQGLTALFEAHPDHAETAHYYALALHLSGRSPRPFPLSNMLCNLRQTSPACCKIWFFR